MKYREFKFRAWDKCNERMVEPRNILKICMSRLNQEPYLIVYLKKWMNENREIKESDKSYTNEFELMQYTGLKDKNGTEIYEGDICRWRDLETFNDEILEDIFVVVWNDEKLAWYTQNEDGNFVYELYEYTDDRDLEVIGNIYENADSLEVEE